MRFKTLVWWSLVCCMAVTLLLLGGCPNMAETLEQRMINPHDHEKFLGKHFVTRQDAPILRIGGREWSRTELVQVIGVGNFAAAGALTTVCRKAGIKSVEELYAVDPRELASVKGFGETKVFVAMAVLQAEGFDARGWWERMSAHQKRMCTFRTLKIHEKKMQQVRRRRVG